MRLKDFLLVVLLLLVTGCSNPRTPYRTDVRNVIFIVVDTIRANHLGFMGYDRGTSPFLDEFAARSIIFDNMYTPKALTHPSFTSLLSGLHPIHNKIYKNMWPISEDLHMLPEDFQTAGYRTVFLSASAIINSQYRMDQGFDEYVDCDPHPEEAWSIIEKVHQQTEDLSKPLFLGIHLWEPHSPYDPHPEYLAMYADPGYEGPMDGSIEVLDAFTLYQVELKSTDIQHAVDRYDGEIRFIDDKLRELFDYFEEKGLINNSIIIITADHGESLGDDHIFQHRYDTEVELHIPLIMHFPHDVNAGLRIPALSDNTDIMPTVMDILGIQIPPDLDGISMFPLFNDPTLEHRDKLLSVGVNDSGRFVYSEFDGRTRIRIEPPVEEPEPVWLDEQSMERLRALGYIH